MKKPSILVITFCISLITFNICMGLPPDKLDFSSAKYFRRMDQLFHEKVVHVCIYKQGDTINPSAIVFEDKIVFLDNNGNQTSERAFGSIREVRVTESVSGKYIYVFGSFNDKPGGIHRLYTHDGKVVLEKDTLDRIGFKGFGVPVEGKEFFVLARDGELTLTNFKGDIIASKKILDADKGEDGDVLTAVTQKGNKIFVGANKLRMPPENNQKLPDFYTFDSNLDLIRKDSSTYLMILDIQCTPDGKFLIIRAEAAGELSPLVITDTSYHELLSLDNAQAVKFSDDENYMIHIPRSGSPEIISCSNWQVFFRPIMSNDYPWLDYDISNDGSSALLFNGNEILLLDCQKKTWHLVDFPFSFTNCRISGNGHRLILMGEFGFVVYDIVTE